MRALVICAAVLITAPLHAQPAPAQQADPAQLALINVTVIDGTGAAATPRMTLVINEGRVVDLFPSREREPPPSAEILDLTGKTVIPGLIDSHIHLGQLRTRERRYAELERMFYGGIVVARHMAGDMRIVAEVSRAALVGAAIAPDIYYSALMGGPYFATTDPRMTRAAAGLTPGAVPWAQAITPETDLRLAVARAAGTGASGIKLYAQLDADLVRAVTEEAHAQGLKVWAHATVYPDRPIEVVRAGVDAVSHACGLGWQDADVDPGLHRRFDVTSRPGFDARVVEAGSAEMTELFEEMVRHGTLFEPTLAVHLRPGDDAYGCTEDLVVALTRAAHRAGVSLLAGTDFHAGEEDPYPSLHREIEALVRHGVLTPLEAIVSATRNGARAIGIEDTHGTIEPGKVANLVVLAADPTQDIKALRSVTTVIKRGKVYQRAEYETRREAVLSAMVVPPVAAQTVGDRLLENHRWYLPDTDGSFPTVVAVPGCSGVSLDSPQTDQGRPGHFDDVLFRLHYPLMAERLRHAGFAVLLLDLLSAEGVLNACSGEIAAPRIAQYISAAIELAKRQPHVDASEIFVLGWSMGGGGVIAWLSDADIDPAAVRGAIAIYPGCGDKPTVKAQLPFLVLLGGADDIADPGDCEELVGRSPSKALITVKVYEGARHGFDIEEAPEVFEIGGGMTVGYQEDAARAAWQETLAFLRGHQSETIRRAH